MFTITTEVLLNSRSELIVCMMNEGILHVIGDIIVNEMDPLVLVCLFCVFDLFLIHSFIHFIVNCLVVLYFFLLKTKLYLIIHII